MRINTLSKKEFIYFSIFFNCIAYIWYRNLFFTEILYLSSKMSLLILVGAVLAVNCINYYVSGKYARNEKAVITTTILSYGIYALISNMGYMKKAYVCIIAAVISCIVIYLSFVFGRRINDGRRKGRIIRSRYKKGYIGARNIAAYGAIVVLIYTFMGVSL